MPLVVRDRVRETSTTTGTGTFTLGGAVTGFQSFSVIGNGNTTYYTIALQGGNEWEVGIGTYTSAGTTLSRDTVLESSNSGSLVNFSAGTKDVFVTYPAERSVYVDGTAITPAATSRLAFSNLAQGSALSVLGVTGNATADNASIAAGTDHQVLRRSGTSVAFGAVNLAQAAAITGTLPLGNGGTGQTTAPAANAALTGFTSTATAGGTTTLTNTSSFYQIFTGSSNQTVDLPATSTLAQGWSFHIVNNSTGTLTLRTSTAVSLGTIPSGVTVMATALTTSGNTASDWEFGYTDFSTLTGTGSVVLSSSPNLVAPVALASTTTTQDGIIVTGRAGGSSSFRVTLQPTTLGASRTITLPDATTTMVGTDATQTLTNKRVTPRVSTATSSATPTINTDTVDMYGLTAQAVDITSFTTNLSGTPTNGQKLWIYIVGTASRAITWGASFEASTIALPTTTSGTNRLDVGFVWNAVTSKWRCVAAA